VLISRSWMRRVLHVLTSGPALTIEFILVLLLSLGPLMELDEALNHNWRRMWPEPFWVFKVIEALGQRAVCLPILFAVAVVVARRRRSWEPLVVAVGGVLAVNFVVGVLKLLTARGNARLGDPDFFEQGILFPSGHAANALMVYGLATYLARSFHGRDTRTARFLLGLTWFVSASMVVVGLYFQWHWFTDLIAGFLIGGAVLRLTIYVHREMRRRIAVATHDREAANSAALARVSRILRPVPDVHPAVPEPPSVDTDADADPEPDARVGS
jgi:membrane-associated phospholipid phosphatase